MSVGAPVAIPESHKELLTGPIVVSLVTVMPDGQPQATPVWCDYDGAYIIVNTARGRQKDRNMTRNAKVTILAIDPKDGYHWLEVRGVVDEITEKGAVEVIDKLAKLYRGKDHYFGDIVPAEQRHIQTRVTYKIRPTKVNASKG